jgi:hypothetical protein
VTGVERGLAAADLPARELDLEAGAAEQRRSVLDGIGKDEVPEAGREELDSSHGGSIARSGPLVVMRRPAAQAMIRV